ncbi:hypothetical protein Rumeso_03119 [Rubellimicrobium mesophilum DSM 19309]|uniref:Helix-turn-helix domain-containing protein n=2 Tax=Rubellimicrobium TaxID=295418 RepID=A0A017HLU1_9RHOB|nr:hypothetical protein Rumeso_03119 [Rubellimicrobium mesophilum DSM 19309]
MARPRTQLGKVEVEVHGFEPDYLDPQRAAEYLGLSVSFLAKLRMAENRHRGPAFVKLGKVVLYRRTDLDQWLASHVVGGV